MTTVWIVLLGEGGRACHLERKNNHLFSLLVTEPTKVNGSVAIDLCGLSSGPVYATASWRDKKSMVKGKRSKRGEVKHRRRIEPFVY